MEDCGAELNTGQEPQPSGTRKRGGSKDAETPNCEASLSKFTHSAKPSEECRFILLGGAGPYFGNSRTNKELTWKIGRDGRDIGKEHYLLEAVASGFGKEALDYSTVLLVRGSGQKRSDPASMKCVKKCGQRRHWIGQLDENEL
ncbi:hypothetical protein KOW79_015174 [Hemibagrus wyckioides]|uniref:Uncharacterized protein n=1 Tax=Hemibagrus wyckioides TaxID=337641 RepID=A0A9D3NFQ1_9TELE|nr:hypothetical protein KOW79_015174 [Hemibagrus wyckioides]